MRISDVEMQLRLGDHVWSRRAAYTHHGIYLGGNEVIHYAGLAEGLSRGPLEITTIDRFCQGHSLHLQIYDEPKYSPYEVCERALSRLGEDEWHITNNCEHFAYWAVMGESRSRQLEWADAILGAIHPGLEAASKSYQSLRQQEGGWRRRQELKKIGKELASDWTIKSSARLVAGVYGVAAFAAWRLGKEWYRQKRQR